MLAEADQLPIWRLTADFRLLSGGFVSGVGDRMGRLAVGTVVTISAGFSPSTGRSVVGVGFLLLAGEQLLQEQEFGQDQSDDGHDQSLLGDQSDTEQSQDGQTDDLQLDESEDWQQRLEELLLASGFRDHGAHG